MKALTVRQPWASLIIAGYKPVENRSWYTPHRGQLAIHAGKGIDKDGMREHLILVNRLMKEPGDLPHGGVLGTVTLIDCVDDRRTRWADLDTTWYWILANAHRFRHPVPAKGKLRLWTWRAH